MAAKIEEAAKKEIKQLSKQVEEGAKSGAYIYPIRVCIAHSTFNCCFLIV